MKSPSPIERREELRDQLDRLEKQTDAIDARFAAIRAEYGITLPRPGETDYQPCPAGIGTLSEEARVQEARGIPGADAEVMRLVALQDELTAELPDLGAKSAAVGRARNAVLQDIERLHNAERDAFVEDAERYTAKAHAAMEALREPYEAAIDAWNQARTAWAPLVADVDTLSLPPSPPLPHPADVFNPEVQARPAELGNHVEPELPPSTWRSWKLLGYPVQQTVFGTPADNALAANPKATLVKVSIPRGYDTYGRMVFDEVDPEAA